MNIEGMPFASSTTNRGVEVKESELANTYLVDMNASSMSQFPCESNTTLSEAAAGAGDGAGSFLQVVVHKHRQRLPAASSPSPPAPAPPGALAPASNGQTVTAVKCACGADEARASGGRRPAAPACCTQKGDAAAAGDGPVPAQAGAAGAWDGGPDRVEVHYFERGAGEFLASRGARATAVERWAGRAARPLGAALHEALAAARLLLALPLCALLALVRAALAASRGALAGGVQAASDELLKPALTLSFNALLRPPLVFAMHVARALRAALHPLAGALGDASAPFARLLASLRLVHVHVERRCECYRAHPPQRDFL